MNDARPDIFDDDQWMTPLESATTDELNSLALPGPSLTYEQLMEAIREGDESGIYEGDPFAEIRDDSRTRRSANLAA